ncbi:uncharacterized protein [Prorops nasuta]|uniref:uncharacterized protein n=1 Tax=Prorops nasuta TaxID=863751 RepID=UPI0034D00F00
MTDRIKLIIQERPALKSQMTTLINILDKDSVEHTFGKLRMKRLTELYRVFEELFDELMVLEPSENHQAEFEEVQKRFYNIAVKVENLTSVVDNASTTNSIDTNNTHVDENTNAANSGKIIIRLPEISLSVFNGKYEEWLSFKTAFRSIIDSRTDLSDIEKLKYLKSTLVDEAAKKIAIFSISSANYAKAWELLERSYEVKRILISRHLSLILNLPNVEKEST